MAKINLSEYPFAYYSPDPITKRPLLADIGSAISIGGSLLGGMMGDSASGDAAGQANAGLKMGIDELKKTDARTLEQTQPYRDLGESSTNRLSYLFGLANLDPQSQYDKKYGQLVDTSTGVPKPNAALYSSDASYRKAWDDTLAEHAANPANRKAAGGAYTADSTVSWIDQQVRNKLPGVDSIKPLDTSDGQYGSLLKSFSQDDLNKDVVYNNGLKFGLDQGTTQLNNRAAAMGSYDSGQTLKDLAKWANDYGTTKTGEAQQRFMGDKAFTLGSLMGGTRVGQDAVNTSANSGNAIGTAIAGSMGSIGSNNAAGTMGSANSWSTAIGGATKAAAGIDWSKWFN